MNKNESILYFLDYGKVFGGAVHTLIQQALLMKKAGYKVFLFFSDYLGKGLQNEYREIVQRLEMTYEWATFQLTSQPEDIDLICLDKNYEQLKNKIASYKPVILHSVQINPCVELVSRELKIPHIMNIYQFMSEFFTFEYTDIFPKYHICDSWYWAKKWNEFLNTDYTCIRTVVNQHCNLIYQKLYGKTIQYLCAGVLYTGKNQLNVIKAFHQALQEGISGMLNIYGYDDTAYAGQCKDYILENNLSKWIHIKGFCSDMEKVYSESDVLICGSSIESYPNVISEAMAYGLIVISTSVAGVPELVKDGENGYLAENDSPEAICRKIVEFNRDIGQKRLDKIKKNSFITFKQNHTPEVVTKNLMTYYRHVIEDNQKSSNVMISDIRRKFASLIHSFYQYSAQFTDPRKIALKLWYLYHITPTIETAVQKKAAFYIWGTGEYGTAVKEMVEVFLPEVEIAGFMDSNRSGTFFEHVIYEPKEILKKKNIVVLVAIVNGQQEILRQLKDSYKIYNKDYFILSARVW